MWAGWLAPSRPDGQHRLWLMEPTHSAACDAINPKRTTDKYNDLNLMADAVNFWRRKNHQNEQMHILWTSCGSSWLSTSGFLHIDAICWALPKKGLCRSMFDCNRCVLHEGEWPLSCVCSLVTARDLPVCPLGTILLIRLLSTNQKSSLSHPPYRAKRPLERVWHGSWTPYTHTEATTIVNGFVP